MDDAVGIAFAAGLPFAGLRDVAPDPALLEGFPPGWLAARQVLPLAFADGTLTLASATPSPDLAGLDPTLTIMVVISPAAEIAGHLAAAEAPRAEAPPRVEEPPPVEAPPRAEAPPRVEAPPPRTALPAPDRDALALVPEHLQRRLGCLPLTADDRHVQVACADPPPSGAALDALRASVAPRELRVLAADPLALDERLVAVHGARWAAAIERGLPRVAAPDAPARPADAPPPRTTLLLPLPGGVGPAVQAATTLAALDHPRDLLDVVLLVAAGDAQGALAARTTGHRVVVAPASLPGDRTALLDLGLLLARGEHVAVLDPGDIPAPRLLAHADAALAGAGRRGGPDGDARRRGTDARLAAPASPRPAARRRPAAPAATAARHRRGRPPRRPGRRRRLARPRGAAARGGPAGRHARRRGRRRRRAVLIRW